MNFFVASYTDYPLFVFGMVVLALVLFLPAGIVGTLFSREKKARAAPGDKGRDGAASAPRKAVSS